MYYCSFIWLSNVPSVADVWLKNRVQTICSDLNLDCWDAFGFVLPPWMRYGVGPEGRRCPSVFDSTERSSPPSALQPSLTQRRLLKIMFGGIVHSSHFCLLRGGQAEFLLASLDWLPNRTIGYDPSPAVARHKIKTFLPSSLITRWHWWVSGNNYPTLSFFSTPLMFSRKNGFSTDVCPPAGFSVRHKEALRLWNVNDLIVTNTGSVIDRRRHCPVRWPGARHFTSFYPSWYKYRWTERNVWEQSEQAVIVQPDMVP